MQPVQKHLLLALAYVLSYDIELHWPDRHKYSFGSKLCFRVPGSAPSGTAQVGTRYWHITQTGGSGLTYNITLDGTGLTFTTTPKILKYDSPNTVAYAATETPTTDY